MALNANALVTVAQVKSQLDIQGSDTSQDTRIDQLINAASDHLEYLTGRKLKSQSFTHQFPGSGTPFLLLREYPVTAVSAVHVDATWAFGAGALVASTEYRMHKGIGLIRRGPTLWDCTDALAVQVAYTAGYASVPVDLQQATLTLIEIMYDMRDQRSTRIQSRAKLGDSVSWLEKIPEHVTAMIAPHVREAYVKRLLESA